MKKQLFPILVALAFAACANDDRDMDRPLISSEGVVASPNDCDSYACGDTIHFCYRMQDNAELGSYNIEVHSNHDHHTHSTSAAECQQHQTSATSNPWVFNRDFKIADGLRDYTARVDIAIPADVDPGDYHFMIRLTDKAGWQEIRSVAISIEQDSINP